MKLFYHLKYFVEALAGLAVFLGVLLAGALLSRLVEVLLPASQSIH